jgi:adenylate kinase
MQFILCGLPGSGKGTQAELLCKSYNFKLISPGDILRNAIKTGKSEYNELKSELNSGRLLPDNTINKLVLNEFVNIVNKSDNDSINLLWDGFPRSINQAEFLLNLLMKHGLKVDFICVLDLKHEVIINRILYRVICDKCHRVYNKIYNFPVDGKCSFCGCSSFFRRSDDNRDALLFRLQNQQKVIDDLLHFFKSVNLKINHINADSDINHIHECILKLIDMR